MDQNPPYTAPLGQPTPLASSSVFSPISNLIKSAWDKTQKNLLQLFLLTILVAVIGFVVILLMGLLVVLTQAVLSGTSATMVTGILLAIGIPVAIVIMMSLNIGLMVILAEKDPHLSVIGVLKKATQKVWPLLVASVLGGLIVLGGMVLLIIPGILFSLLLSFSAYYVVIDGISPLEAMRKSVYITSKNFGVIFVRLAVLFGLGFVAGIILNMLTSQTGDFVGSLISFVFNILFSWFSIAYMLDIFQQAKKVGGDGRGKLLWMSVVALIGWLIIIGGGYLIYQSAATRTTTRPVNSLQFDNSLLDLDTDERLATPPASIRPASASASVKPTATPRASATPKASAATSSASR